MVKKESIIVQINSNNELTWTFLIIDVSRSFTPISSSPDICFMKSENWLMIFYTLKWMLSNVCMLFWMTSCMHVLVLMCVSKLTASDFMSEKYLRSSWKWTLAEHPSTCRVRLSTGLLRKPSSSKVQREELRCIFITMVTWRWSWWRHFDLLNTITKSKVS